MSELFNKKQWHEKSIEKQINTLFQINDAIVFETIHEFKLKYLEKIKEIIKNCEIFHTNFDKNKFLSECNSIIRATSKLKIKSEQYYEENHFYRMKIENILDEIDDKFVFKRDEKHAFFILQAYCRTMTNSNVAHFFNLVAYFHNMNHFDFNEFSETMWPCVLKFKIKQHLITLPHALALLKILMIYLVHTKKNFWNM